MPIFIAEQTDGKPFNRAAMMNLGYALEGHKYDYAIYHDVDMICEQGDYSYSEVPAHMATACSQFGYKMPYPEYFGGVTLMPNDVMKGINGFSNIFWGWGGEDDNIRLRILGKGYKIESRECIYNSLHHDRVIDHNLHKINVENVNKVDYTDGLSTVDINLGRVYVL